MHIKKLEISGFKSFVDRTVVHFDHDVIGIVGPNGCGKSNIVDALRWCMGEQSAKHLRGRSMEDVIFNGSESRKPHGVAEVTLTFDNTDPNYAATLPEDYRGLSEISVTRRLFRDGTSEYLINRAAVRLRDITDLFLGTGVGTKAYSIVEQGRIGQIVSARPQDRRLFIEEAAGITKYRLRRRQTERKIELSEQNLARIRDIVSEIDRNRSGLRRQAAKAERFLRYREESERLVLHQAAHQFLELTVVGRLSDGVRREQGTLVADLQAQLDVGVAEQERLRMAGSAADEQHAQASERSHAATSQVALLDGELTRGQDRIVHLTERVAQSSQAQSELVLRIGTLTEECQELESRQSQLGEQHRELAARTPGLEGRRQELEREESEVATHAERLRREVASAGALTAAAQVRVQALQERAASGTQRQGEVTLQLDDVRRRLDEAQNLSNRLAPEVERMTTRQVELRERRTTSEQVLRDLQAESKRSEQGLREQRREADRLRAQLTTLEDLHRRFEGLSSAARPLLASAPPGVHGLFIERLEVPAALSLAIAAALGDRVEAVVSTDAGRALELIEIVRERKQGRIALVSAETRPWRARNERPAIEAQGAVGWADELVGCAPSDRPLVAALLGEVAVTEEAKQAVELSARLGVLAVAKDGTVAEPSGVVRWGTGSAPALDRKRELSELASRLQTEQLRLEDLERTHEALLERLSAAQHDHDQSRGELHALELQVLSAGKDLSQSRGQVASLATQLERLSREQAAAEELHRTSRLEGEQKAEELRLLRERLESLSTEFATIEGLLSERRGATSSHSNVATEHRVKLMQLSEQLESVSAALERARAALDVARSESSALRAAAEEADVALGLQREQCARLEADLAAAQQSAQQAAQDLAAARQDLDRAREAHSDVERRVLALREEHSKAQAVLLEAEMKSQKLELERQHLVQSVRERFRGLELDRVIGDYHALAPVDAAHRARISELSTLIERMGPVNLDAQAEYDAAEQRYLELSGQKEDIEKALADLQQAIKHIDRESKRRLKETFNAVSELFEQMFRRMFKGGQAKLVLTDPDNLLESGIDIVAQPPGKKLGTVELMSGGEKALTAASLIFAIFQYRPSPFCVLDEVDAPLDEANVGRYNEAIRAMTDRSQFIVITHIKKTMQSVDLLYGVTMGEPGVSRVVSVKVNEHAKPRQESYATRPPRSAPAPVDDIAAEDVQVA